MFDEHFERTFFVDISLSNTQQSTVVKMLLYFSFECLLIYFHWLFYPKIISTVQKNVTT